MTRHGSALLMVLWLLVVCTTSASLVLLGARSARGTSHNRIRLLRAEWAREACAEIAQGRLEPRSSQNQGPPTSLDTVDLGRGTWCRASVWPAGTKLDVNSAGVDALRALIHDDSATDALLDWMDPDTVPRARGAESWWYRSQGRPLPRNGPLVAMAELRWVRGFDSIRVEALEKVLAVGTEGRLDPNAASPELLGLLPGLDRVATSFLVNARLREHIGSMDALLAELPPAIRRSAQEHYRELSERLTFAPEYVADIEAGIAGSRLHTHATLLLVPVSGGLTVQRRRLE